MSETPEMEEIPAPIPTDPSITEAVAVDPTEDDDDAFEDDNDDEHDVEDADD